MLYFYSTMLKNIMYVILIKFTNICDKLKKAIVDEFLFLPPVLH